METATIDEEPCFFADPHEGRCFHCGEALPSDPLTHFVKGAPLAFCCQGCLSVCRYIYEAGLDVYYEKREKERPGRPVSLEVVHFVDEDHVEASGDMSEASLIVEGVHCSACIWLIEKVTSHIDGVASSRLNFSTHRLKVRWDGEKTSLKDIISRVGAVGYRATPYDPTIEAPLEKRRDDAVIRLAVAGFGTVATMFLAEGLYGGFLWGMDESSRFFLEILSLLVAVPVVFYAGLPFLRGAFYGIRARALTMDLPIALGILITFGYSLASVAGVAGAAGVGGGVYFDSAAMFIFLILIGRLLEAEARKRAGWTALGLSARETMSATLCVNGARREVAIKSLVRGDIVEVKPGEKVPVDGVVFEGAAKVDESMLTGESLAVDKSPGAKVWSGAMNLDGRLLVKVTAAGDFTRLSSIKRLVEDALLKKTAIQRVADRAAGWFIPIVLAIAALTFIYWSIHAGTGQAAVYAVSVLIITCPCALALATPAAILAGTSRAAGEGILVKGSEVLEKACKATHVVFDKTGTLTEGRMSVTEAVPSEGVDEAELFTVAASIEQYSEHPIGKAIHAEALRRSSDILRSSFKAHPGKGVEGELRIIRPRDRRSARWNGASAWVGSAAFITGKGFRIPLRIIELATELARSGRTVVFVARSGNDEALGLVAVSDPVRKDGPELVSRLKNMGLKVSLLSGDVHDTASAVGKAVGIDDIAAGVLPEGKEAFIRRLRERGEKVIMVGDGVNDGPALAASDVGIAMGNGTDLAIGSADIVLLDDRTANVARAVELSRGTMRAIKENLAISVVYNIIVTPLAAIGLVFPLLAAVAMPLSSLVVIGNSIRRR